MCVSGVSSDKARYGWLALFYYIEIFYIELAFFTTWINIFDNILLTIHNKMFRRAKTYVGSGNLNTHVYILLA